MNATALALSHIYDELLLKLNLLIWLYAEILFQPKSLKFKHSHGGKLEGGLEEHRIQSLHLMEVEMEAGWGVVLHSDS